MNDEALFLALNGKDNHVFTRRYEVRKFWNGAVSETMNYFVAEA